MKRSATSLYAQLRGSVDRDRKTSVLFLFCTVAHGVAHGLLALAAGALVRALALGLAPMDERSTSPLSGISPVAVAFVGVVAATAKGITSVFSAWTQAKLVGVTGQRLREQVLCARLRRGPSEPRGGECQLGHADHGLAPELAPSDRPGRPETTPAKVRLDGSTSDVARGVASLTTHVREVELAMSAGLLQAVRATGELVPVLVVLVVVDRRLAAGAVLVLAPFAWLLGRLRRAWKRRQLAALQESEALFAAADEATRHADLFRVYRAEARARRKVAELGARLTQVGAALASRAALLSGANEVLAAVALLVVVAAASRWSPHDRASLVPFAVAFFLAYKPLRDLSDARLAWAKGEVALERLGIDGGLEVGGAGLEEGGASPHTYGHEALEVEALVLGRGTLSRPVHFVLQPGDVLGLVAPTGRGKTTLLRVLLGLEPPLSGVVRYGGLELGPDLGPGERPFAWVPQDAPLVSGSLAENVGLGHSGTVDTGRVLGELGASELVGEVGDAAVGSGGRTLSGGERQWVALARAFAAERPVLLLDEPTSGLDAESQARVLRAIATLRGRRTVVIVTHRREALAVCDEVVELS